MNGVEIQYLLGLYFLIVSITFEGGRISADTVKLIAGIVLVLMAIFGLTLIR